MSSNCQPEHENRVILPTEDPIETIEAELLLRPVTQRQLNENRLYKEKTLALLAVLALVGLFVFGIIDPEYRPPFVNITWLLVFCAVGEQAVKR